MPHWVDTRSPLTVVARTVSELSILAPAAGVPSDVRAEDGFRVIEVVGPVPFSVTGLIASIAGPLAGAGISLFPVATYRHRLRAGQGCRACARRRGADGRRVRRHMKRREFLLAMAAAPLLPRAPVVQTVNGPVAPETLGVTLAHEHVLVDFIGADRVSPSRYDRDAAFRKALPHLERIHALGCRTLVECTPAYIGRDVVLAAAAVEGVRPGHPHQHRLLRCGQRQVPAAACVHGKRRAAGRAVDCGSP